MVVRRRTIEVRAEAERLRSAGIRDHIESSRELLDDTIPDTFLGRRTHPPFPDEDDGTDETG